MPLRTRSDVTGRTVTRCQCHRELAGPKAPHWRPIRDPEPGAEVRAVAFAEDDPAVLQMVRAPGGWHAEGVAAPHPELTGLEPWALVGQCWAGSEHAVVDVTTWPRDGRPSAMVANDDLAGMTAAAPVALAATTARQAPDEPADGA